MIFSKYINTSRAFTLSEILIALVVIGVISAITVPTIVIGTNDANYKRGYKKAYTIIKNVADVMKSESALPNTSTPEAGFEVFSALVANLDVKGFANSGTSEGNVLNRNKPYDAGAIKAGVIYNGVSFGVGGEAGTFPLGTTNMHWSPWIVTEDNMAYSVKGTNGTCSSVAKMSATGVTEHMAWLDSCVLIAVDVNGLTKGPNMIEPQVQKTTITEKTKLDKLTGDIYFIYLGKDGATPGGNKALAGCPRIIADMN